MSDVLVVLAHPSSNSFNATIAQRYLQSMQESGIEATLLSLSSLSFDPVLRAGFSGEQALEPDLVRSQALIAQAKHVVWVYPTWWGNWPGLLKGFVDRVFLPGWAFRFNKGSALPVQLLKGRSSRVITTMDSPWWWYRMSHGRAGHRSMVNATLRFVGMGPVFESTLYRCQELNEQQRGAWLQKIEAVARKDAKRLRRTLASERTTPQKDTASTAG